MKNTMKITSAMKMVSSVKLHKAQAAVGGLLPYQKSLDGILKKLLESTDFPNLNMGDLSCIKPSESAAKVAVVVISSNNSLCGAFNANITRRFHRLVEELGAEGVSPDQIDLYALGARFAESAARSGYIPLEKMDALSDKPDYEAASSLADTLVGRFSKGEVSRVILLYSHFVSATSQQVLCDDFLPYVIEQNAEGEISDCIVEPDPMSLLKALMPKVLRLKLYAVLLDANAAEHAARTLAMQIATDNAEDLIGELTLAYNKGRQQEITAEILDLAAGMQ